MNLEHYTYFTNNDFHEYEFYSIGPKGRIKKLVTFTKVKDDPVIFNLAFGDEDPNTGKIIDSITTNNNDRDIVLATIANIVNDFSDQCGNYFIYAEGSTSSRTRLYQIGISRVINQINTAFDIYGLKNVNWQSFQINTNYEAFLVKKKQ